jgi:hypothetical protein
LNRYDVEPGKPYLDLLKILKGKDYFDVQNVMRHDGELDQQLGTELYRVT